MGKTIKSAKSGKVGTSSIRFFLAGCRPGSGNQMASHTAAFLQLSGLDDGGTIPLKQARDILGDSAISNHCKQGNFEKTPDGLKLTERGFLHFGNVNAGNGPNRNIRPEPELMRDYIETLSTGKTNGTVKNAAMVKPISK